MKALRFSKNAFMTKTVSLKTMCGYRFNNNLIKERSDDNGNKYKKQWNFLFNYSTRVKKNIYFKILMSKYLRQEKLNEAMRPFFLGCPSFMRVVLDHYFFYKQRF